MSLDTSLQRCSVAIVRDGAPLSVLVEEMERGHAERLAPMAAAALAEAGVDACDFDRIGVIVGPGGFTGVRVALSFARALGLAASVEVVGVTSLAAIAAGASDGLVASLIDARRGEVYGALYESGAPLVEPFVATPAKAIEKLGEAAIAAPVVVGSGAQCVSLPAGWAGVDKAAQIDPLVVARLAAAAPPPKGPPAPLYLRAPDAKPPAPRKNRS